jgi:hypothetical protein
VPLSSGSEDAPQTPRDVPIRSTKASQRLVSAPFLLLGSHRVKGHPCRSGRLRTSASLARSRPRPRYGRNPTADSVRIPGATDVTPARHPRCPRRLRRFRAAHPGRREGEHVLREGRTGLHDHAQAGGRDHRSSRTARQAHLRHPRPLEHPQLPPLRAGRRPKDGRRFHRPPQMERQATHRDLPVPVRPSPDNDARQIHGRLAVWRAATGGAAPSPEHCPRPPTW